MTHGENGMDLGTFSVSLAVADIAKSRAFYEAFGFEVIAGNQDENWLILSNGGAHIGLFEGMFEENILTFNPLDVRRIQDVLRERGIDLMKEAEPGEGPEHVVLKDPDGNVIMLDQHE